MTTKKKLQSKAKVQQQTESEFLVLGHLIKYNLYLLAKSVVFSAVSREVSDPSNAVDITNRVMQELDLDLKRRQSDLESDNVQ